MKANPLVSVIVPTKNSMGVLDACLISIKNQTYKNLEIIVVDNSSSDKTQEIAKKYTNKVFNEGNERSAQRNYGAKESKGEYIIFVDSDMELDKNVVKDCIKKIDTNLNIVAIVIPEESFGEGFWAECKKLERSFYVGIDWIEAARFYKKTAFKKVNGYDETMISGEDWDISERIKATGKVERINTFIYHNEGHIFLLNTIAKKLYYAKKILNYSKIHKSANSKKQFNILTRYKLYFNKPDRLFKNPFIGIGMLFMKTLELGIGGFAYFLTIIKTK